MNDMTNRRVSESRQISITEPYEMRHWKQHFECTAQELREAVAAVGNEGADIGAYIELHRSLIPPTPSDTLRAA